MKDPVQLDQFFGISSLQKVVELYNHLTHPVFSIRDLGLTQRTVMNWDNSGLVGIKRESKEEWRRFSLMDYIWLHTIQEMRNMGVPLSIITQAKQTILAPISIQWIYQVIKLHPELLDQVEGEAAKEELRSFLEFDQLENMADDLTVTTLMLLVVESMVKRTPVSMMVFLDGYTIPWYENKPENYDQVFQQKKLQETYIVIPLIKIIKRFLIAPKSLFILNKMDVLSPNEKQLLEIIHDGKYDAVTIHFKNKQMKSLELVKDQEVTKRIVDVLADGSYQDIIIKTHNGRVTKIQNKVKLQFN